MAGLVSTLPLSATLQTGEKSVSNGASSVAVTFEVAFRSVPIVAPVMKKGDAADPNVFLTTISDVTTTGFTAFFSAMTTNGNYTVHYTATGI